VAPPQCSFLRSPTLGGHVRLQVEQLVEMGADPAAKDAKGLDSMHFAAAHGQLDVVRFLWTKGVELDSEDAGAGIYHGAYMAAQHAGLTAHVAVVVQPRCPPVHRSQGSCAFSCMRLCQTSHSKGSGFKSLPIPTHESGSPDSQLSTQIQPSRLHLGCESFPQRPHELL